jgi:hypothetical protein
VLIEFGDAVDYSAAHRDAAMERPVERNHWHAEEALPHRNDRAALNASWRILLPPSAVSCFPDSFDFRVLSGK